MTSQTGIHSAALRSALDAIVTMDHEGRVVEINPAAEQLFGYTDAEARGRVLAELIIPPDLRELHQHGLQRFLAGGQAVVIGRRIEVRALRRDGTEFPVELAITVIASDNGPPLFTGFIRDLTERDRIQAALRDSEALFRSMFDNAAIGMTLSDADAGLISCNRAFMQLVGRDEQELKGHTFFEITHPEDLDTNQALHRDLKAGGIERFQLDKRYLHRDGHAVWARVTVSRVPSRTGQAELMLGMVEDIGGRKEAEQRIEYLATHDELTGLPNRNLILDRITQAIPAAQRARRRLAVVFVDVDRFKVINDGFGHVFADSILQAIAGRLRAAVRPGDTVARQSGDEFLVLLPDLRRISDLYIVIQKLVESFAPPFELDGREVQLSASIGASIYPQDGMDAATLIGNADVAMYRAKELGRNTYQMFTREMSEETRRRVDLETRLRRALQQGHLALVYQPRVELAGGRITGCEALLRWCDPELGPVAPDQFIPVAEDSGLIVPIGDWVLRTACTQNRAWQDAGLAPVVVSVNVSARQFLQQDLSDWVLATLAQTGLHAQWLELELTESVLAQDVERAAAMVRRLKAAGVHVSIDDFGTGYSSLDQLRRFSVDTLKIDQSFVRDMLTEQDDAIICQAVISLAHSLRMKALAEGVETEAHSALLRSYGCDECQGYYFSRPVPPEAFAALLQSGAARNYL